MTNPVNTSPPSAAGGKAAMIGGTTLLTGLLAKQIAAYYGMSVDGATDLLIAVATGWTFLHRFVATFKAENAGRYLAWYRTSNGWLPRQMRAFWGVTQVTTIAILVSMLTLSGCVTNTAKYTVTDFYPDGKPQHAVVIKSRTYATAGSKLAVGKGKVIGYVDGHRITVGQDATGLEAGGEPSKVIESAGPLVLKGLELLAK